MITLDARSYPCAYRIFDTSDLERDLLVQTDYDYCGLASSFGWWPGMVPAPDGAIAGALIGDFRTCPTEHSGTDGTIACPDCGATVADFIASAANWLDDNDGATVEDPGYFEDN